MRSQLLRGYLHAGHQSSGQHSCIFIAIKMSCQAHDVAFLCAWLYEIGMAGKPKPPDKLKTKQIRVLLSETDYDRVVRSAGFDQAEDLGPWVARQALKRAAKTEAVELRRAYKRATAKWERRPNPRLPDPVSDEMVRISEEAEAAGIDLHTLNEEAGLED